MIDDVLTTKKAIENPKIVINFTGPVEPNVLHASSLSDPSKPQSSLLFVMGPGIGLPLLSIIPGIPEQAHLPLVLVGLGFLAVAAYMLYGQTCKNNVSN